MSLFEHFHHYPPPSGPTSPIAYVQQIGYATANSNYSTTIAWSGSVTVGNDADSLIWVGVHRWEATGTVSVTDNLGNTYTKAEETGAYGTYTDGFYAYVTNTGTLTSITATVPNSRGRGIIAAEFSNVGDFVEAGGAGSGSGSPQTWVNAKDIPAYGAALGITTSNANNMTGAGSASGIPSVTPTAHIVATPDRGLMLLSGIAGSSAVSSFTGQSIVGAGNMGNAGAIFKAAA